GILLRADLPQSLRPCRGAPSAARGQGLSSVLGHSPRSLPVAVGNLGGKRLRGKKAVSGGGNSDCRLGGGGSPPSLDHAWAKSFQLRCFTEPIPLWLLVT